MKEGHIKGRGAQFNSHNKFDQYKTVQDHIEGLDEPMEVAHQTQVTRVFPKTILNKVESPDLYDAWSLNPYQGCEHGCIYCYARVTHEYWGYSAGLDFEQKIMVKTNVRELLEKAFEAKSYKPRPIMLSGNTDCYQPLERRYGLTRGVLEVLLKHRHPVSIITKNALILRDIELLKKLNELRLLHVSITITSLDEALRMHLEPRTASYRRRVQLVQELSEAGIPVNVMIAPIIPALNDHHIPEVMEAIAKAGAVSAGYTFVRLNGAIGELFTDWIQKAYPERAEKVLNQIKEMHSGNLHDYRPGLRMKGEGRVAESIRNLFTISKRKYLAGRTLPDLDFSGFVGKINSQLTIF